MSFIDSVSLLGNTAGSATRYQGGTDKSSSDHPFIKGYFYVFFGLPGTLFNDDTISATAAREFLLVSAESYTPPGDRQINLQDVQGQGGVDASFITGQTISREFSIQYKDYWGAPIFRIHRTWTNYINPYLGTSVVASNFSANEYKGACMVIQTKPVARAIEADGAEDWKETDIIKVDYFDGVQPMTDLKSAYDSNITDNSFVKPTVQYKFDGFPLDETNSDVLSKATAVLNNANIFTGIESLYTKLATESNMDSAANTPVKASTI